MTEPLPEHGQPDAVMRALASELASLQSVATDLEECMSVVVGRKEYEKADATDRQIMQDFDLLTQSLEGLREFVHQLATAAEGRPTIRLAEALATIKLGDMRNRLARQDSDGQVVHRTPPTSNQIDLF